VIPVAHWPAILVQTYDMRILLLVTLLTAQVASAQDADACPNPKKLKNLCMFVGDQSAEPAPAGHYRYTYQRKIAEAACVDPAKDSKETQSRKIAAMWKQYESQLTCNNVQFDVQNGSILKFAAAMMFDPFIRDAITWGVPLDRVDADGRTLLDYVRDHRDRNQGYSVGERFGQYYDMLRKAGARHRDELR
jgi:hypothetical protein